MYCKSDSWYYICYDSGGDGFKHMNKPYCYAFGIVELDCAINSAIEDYGLDPEQICVFKLMEQQDAARIDDRDGSGDSTA